MIARAAHYTGKNSDERLEALAQSVELIAAMHRDNEKLMAEMMPAIARLANTAHAHNGQLDDHETRLHRLEDKE